MKSSKIILSLAAAFAMSCGSGSGEAPTLDVDVFGWRTGDGFVPSLPTLDDAQTMRVKLTKPSTGEVVSSDTTPVASRTLSMPELAFGNGLRMDLEVLNSLGEIVGGGATPTFDFGEDSEALSFRIQVTPVNTFSPIGNVVVDRNTLERKFAWTQFDYRGKDVSWLGRSGHATAPTSDGKILVVGGGDPIAATTPGGAQTFRALYNDVQVFDPQTGYFSDLAFDDDTGALIPDGRDTLFEPIVFHTVTPVGNDRFVVAGGFTLRSDVLRPVNTLQLIDLNAAPGSRVTRLTDAAGSSLVLQKARGYHTASYRASDDHLLIAGGLGPQGDDDILGTFEMIDLASRSVYGETFNMVAPRAEHEAVTMADGSIWLIGGRNAGSAVASTESLKLTVAGTTEANEEGTMRKPRLGAGAVRLSGGTGDIILVAGGYTDLEGATDDSYEISRLGRGSFDGGTTWKLTSARAGVTALELPQSKNVLLFGGRDASGTILKTAEIMELDDITAQPPFSTSASSPSDTARFGATTDLLTNGRIVIIGGEGTINGATAGFDSADMFNPLDPVGAVSTTPAVVVTE